MEYISLRSDTIEYFHEPSENVKIVSLRVEIYSIYSFYFMIIDDEIMELFGVFVPVHMRTICVNVFVYYTMSYNDNKSDLLKSVGYKRIWMWKPNAQTLFSFLNYH